MQFLHQLFGPGDFMPHGYCYLWNTRLIWLHLTSDLLITASYFSIPVTLLWFMRRRKDLPFSWMFGLFGVFIVACGATHFMEVWNLWHADYWLSGLIKAVTAVSSVPTAILLVRLVPQALEIPSGAEWIQANSKLKEEVQNRRDLELDLRSRESAYREQAELLDLTHDAIFVRALDSRVLYWNRAAESLYGWTAQEARGKSSHLLLQTVFPVPLEQLIREVTERGLWEGELIHTRKDGTKRVVSSRWALRTNASGEPTSVLESNRDITLRKNEEQKFRSLLESAPDAMVIANQRGEIQLVNSQAEKLFGYSRDEIIGRPVEWLIPSRFRDAHVAHRDRYIDSPRPRSMGEGRELFGQRKDGSEFPVEVSLSPLETAEGILISSAIRDITSRKRAESMFRGLLESAPDAMVIVGPDGLIHLVNAQTERLFGYSREELLGKPVEMLIPERFQANHAGYRHDYVASPRPRSMGAGLDLYGRRKDGTEFPVEVSLSPLETVEGTLISSAIRDVTERRRIQEQLARANDSLEKRVNERTRELAAANEDVLHSHERLELAQKVALIGVFDYNLDGAVANWSAGMFEMYGIPDIGQEITRKLWQSLLLPEGLAEANRVFEEQVATTGIVNLEFQIRRPDGAVRWIASRGKLFPDAAGKNVRLIGVNADVTESKAREEETRRLNAVLEQRVEERTAELQIANQELESFSYSVSHDLRAPLRHMDGFARILKEEFAATLPPDAVRYLDRIVNAANKMGHLVDDLLALSRINRKEFLRTRVALRDIVEDVRKDLAADLDNRTVEWKIATLPEADCDPGLLRIAFMNLISNALKFTRPRPVARIEIGACSASEQPEIFIRDNGVGFDSKYADKLFGVFQRLHRDEEFEGTGVGLATVQRIIHRHGGEIRAESKPGEGAAFFFTLGRDAILRSSQASPEVHIGRI